jgi:hypothetical protein
MDTREDLIRKNTPEAIGAFHIFVEYQKKRFDISDTDIRSEIDARRK